MLKIREIFYSAVLYICRNFKFTGAGGREKLSELKQKMMEEMASVKPLFGSLSAMATLWRGLQKTETRSKVCAQAVAAVAECSVCEGLVKPLSNAAEGRPTVVSER